MSEGQTAVVGDRVLPGPIAPPAPMNILVSGREYDVLRLVATGLTNAEIEH